MIDVWKFKSNPLFIVQIPTLSQDLSTDILLFLFLMLLLSQSFGHFSHPSLLGHLLRIAIWNIILVLQSLSKDISQISFCSYLLLLTPFQWVFSTRPRTWTQNDCITKSTNQRFNPFEYCYVRQYLTLELNLSNGLSISPSFVTFAATAFVSLDCINWSSSVFLLQPAFKFLLSFLFLYLLMTAILYLWLC